MPTYIVQGDIAPHRSALRSMGARYIRSNNLWYFRDLPSEPLPEGLTLVKGRAKRGKLHQPGPLPDAAPVHATPSGFSQPPAALDLDELAERLEDRLRGRLGAQAPPREVIIKVPELPAIKLEKSHFLVPELLKEIAAGNLVMLVGPPGSGKSFAARQVAEVLKRPFFSMSCNPAMTASAFSGMTDANGKNHSTPFIEAYVQGGVILVDEMDAGNAAALVVLNDALANGHFVTKWGEQLKRHKNFIVIAAANTYGTGPTAQFVGRNRLDAATLDRYGRLDWPYDESLERAIAPDAKWCAWVQRVRHAAQALEVQCIISPRASLRGGAALKAGVAWEECEKRHLRPPGMTDAEWERIIAKAKEA